MGSHVILRAAVKFYPALAFMFACSLLAMRPAGAGVGLAAGLAFALGFILYVAAFGAPAARKAAPGSVLRAFLGVGLIAVVAGAGASGVAYAAQIVEGGLFVITASASALMVIALAGRAPTLRDEEW